MQDVFDMTEFVVNVFEIFLHLVYEMKLRGLCWPTFRHSVRVSCSKLVNLKKIREKPICFVE
jgi:hypothetical protein